MTLKKLAYDSPASQDGWEMWQMMRLVEEIKPKVIVEIGVDGGGSLESWQKAYNPEVLIGIDINRRLELQRYDMIYSDSQSEETIEILKKKLDGKKIDFLFIDGDHHYEAVKKEFQLYSGLVKNGGIIGFHDTNSRGIDGVEVDLFMVEIDKFYSFKTADFRTDNKSPGTRLVWL